MDRLDNEDIGLIWARHYPKRSESESSRSLCVTLAMIIKQRAESIILPYDDGADKLRRASISWTSSVDHDNECYCSLREGRRRVSAVFGLD